MKSAVFENPGRILIKSYSKPKPQKDEVRIKIEGCGICGSNKPVWEGREWFNYPLEPGSPGHEGWGFIDAVGEEVENIKIGDRVAALSYHAFAEYDIAKKTDTIQLPQNISNIPFPGEPLGCAINIFNRADVQKDQTVAIIGIGFLGALLTNLVKQAGAKVIAVSHRKFSLDIAEQYNADYSILMDDHWKIIEKVKEITNNNFCERVIEAVGMQWPLDLAGELTCEKGKLIVAGYHQDGLRQVNMQMWNWKGIDVINAHERDQQVYRNGIEEAVEAVSSGRMNPEILYTHSFSLNNINEAFDLFERRPDGFVKALINCN